MRINRPASPLIYLLAAAGLLYLAFIWRTSFDVDGQRYFTLVDDAMISMRYARNLADGYGLVWNPGGPPIEGFTNPGWMLVMALVHLVPFSPAHISLAVMLIAATLLLANVVVVFHIVRLLDPAAALAPWIAAMMMAFYFPLVFWTLRGLELGALTLAIDVGLLLVLRIDGALRRRPAQGRKNAKTRTTGATAGTQPVITDMVLLGLILAAALLIRLDSILQISALLVYLVATVWRAGTAQRTPDRRLFVAAIPVVAALVATGAILIFQKGYFGDLLPNTYYLKINGVTAWERIRTGLLSLNDYASRDFLMPLAIAGVALALIRELRSPQAILLLGLFMVQPAYSIWVGGDYAEELVDAANRFIAQGMPALFILFALALDLLLRRARDVRFTPWIGLAVGLAALVVVSGEPWAKWVLSNAPMLRTDIQRVKLGLHIAAHTDPAAVIAVHAAGQIPYYSERTSIDLLGKNDPFIAKGPPAGAFAAGHNKWNYEYSILELEPDVIADNFYRFSSFITQVPEYVRLPNGIYVRVGSPLVDANGLGADY